MTVKETASVPIGGTFEWKLESNPSTGYSWAIGFGEPLSVESEFITKSDLCGAPGIQCIRITSADAGEFRVVAEYKRPWENCEPLETRILEIVFS